MLYHRGSLTFHRTRVSGDKSCMGGGRSESILRGMEGHWFNAIASHCEAESDEGSQLVLMTMQFPSETRMQIGGRVKGSKY